MPDIKHFDPDVVLETVMRLFWRQGVATTGLQDIVAATGLSRSSLYATFGGKRELYVAALRRYADERSRPAFALLATSGRGLTAIEEFFHGLIEIRCSGEHARWGCLVSNARPDTDAEDVRQVLALHHDQLRVAMRAALETAELWPGVDLDTTAELLALLTYGINVHSRGGADAAGLHAAVAAALNALHQHNPTKETEEHG